MVQCFFLKNWEKTVQAENYFCFCIKNGPKAVLLLLQKSTGSRTTLTAKVETSSHEDGGSEVNPLVAKSFVFIHGWSLVYITILLGLSGHHFTKYLPDKDRRSGN